MNIKKNKLFKGLLALVITLALLYAAQNVWMNYAVASPLDKTLNDVDGVAKVTLRDTNKLSEPVIIVVTLDHDINLEKTYSAINEKIVETLNKKPYVLKLSDNRTPELEQLYYDIHFYVQQAMVDGNFPLLAENAREKAEALNAAARVYVDDKNIYLQLIKNDNFLYTIVSRPSQKIGGDM